MGSSFVLVGLALKKGRGMPSVVLLSGGRPRPRPAPSVAPAPAASRPAPGPLGGLARGRWRLSNLGRRRLCLGGRGRGLLLDLRRPDGCPVLAAPLPGW